MMNKDQLSWDEFYKESNGRSDIPKKINEFNRLVAHTKNFFIISGYGAFTPGYLLIISKDFIPSYGLVAKNQFSELSFIIEIIKKTLELELDRNSVVFEHGMCACIGGLDRAHIHIMSIPKNSNEDTLIKSINSVLFNRKAGIKYIEYKNYKLQNIHDINQIYEDLSLNKEKNNDFKIVGKLLEIKDIQNLPVNEWPFATFDHINKGGHYVYFKSDYENSSFLTTQNFQTQFGREVVFQNELILNDDFKNLVKSYENNNKNLNVWRWQHYIFEKEILESMKIAKSGFSHLKNSYKEKFEEYKFEII